MPAAGERGCVGAPKPPMVAAPGMAPLIDRLFCKLLDATPGAVTPAPPPVVPPPMVVAAPPVRAPPVKVPVPVVPVPEVVPLPGVVPAAVAPPMTEVLPELPDVV